MKTWALFIQQVGIVKPKAMEPSFYDGRCAYCGTPLPYNRKRFCTDSCSVRHNNVIRPKTRKGRKEVVRAPRCS